METDALRLFVLAAEKLNISAAGRALDITPAAASAKLAKLEKSVGAELLHRSTRRVALSPEGADFLPYARDMLAQEDAALAALGQTRPEVAGLLRLTAPSTFAQLYIAPILPEFLADHPGVALDLRLLDTPLGLTEGSYDLALCSTAPEDQRLLGRKLADDTRVLCAAPSYLERAGMPQEPGDLADHQMIGFRDQSLRMLVARSGRKSAFDPAAAACRFLTDDGLSRKAATIAGAGISANSLWSVHTELRSGRLIRVLPDYEVADDTVLWLTYPRVHKLSAKVRAFMDFLVERIGRNPPWLSDGRMAARRRVSSRV